ncbi:MAG TPA: hypothetical protein VN901_16600 [Candidatus Acidoferrales bacterium]|nr:hypothetical protein [Candidatus Acidoferrales bacterium]
MTLPVIHDVWIKRRTRRKRNMATATLAATLNAPISELRPAPMERILVIERDRALRKILARLFAAEGYEADVSPTLFLVWRDFTKACQRQWSSIYLVRIFSMWSSQENYEFGFWSAPTNS